MNEIEKAIEKFEWLSESPKNRCLSDDAKTELVPIVLAALREKQEYEENPGEVSDGYHTFNELYHHRAVLFSVICNEHIDKAWKSLKHDTGDMYDGMFIVGIETPRGQATYHYNINPYWDMFKVKELPKAPEWDGHTPAQAIARIASLTPKEVQA